MFLASLATFLLDRTDEQIYRKVVNSVVEVCTCAPSETVPSFSGTGFSVRIAGKTVFVTAAHVVDDLPVTVVIGDKLVKCKVWKDPQLDYAVLKPETPVKVPSLQFSFKKPVVGQDCWMVGFPCPGNQPLQRVLSKFIVNQYPVDDWEHRGYILGVNGRFTGGSSGSPLVDKNGQVIGVACTYFAESTDLSFGVGITLVKYGHIESWLRKN